MATIQRIAPSLWIDTGAKDAAEFYVSVNDDSRMSNAFLRMKKLEIAELKRAFRGE